MQGWLASYLEKFSFLCYLKFLTDIIFSNPDSSHIPDKTWSTFHDFVRTGQIIDLGERVPYSTFDVVGQLLLGGEIGFVEGGEDVDDIISSIHIGWVDMRLCYPKLSRETYFNSLYLMENMGSVPLRMFLLNNIVFQFLVERFGRTKLNAFQKFLNWLEKRVTDRMEHGLGDPDDVICYSTSSKWRGSTVEQRWVWATQWLKALIFLEQGPIRPQLQF